MIDLGLFLPPFLAGLLVLSTHVPLGREVLRRGVIFVDLAIAQVAAFGVVFAKTAGWEQYWLVQIAAVAVARELVGFIWAAGQVVERPSV